MIPLNLNDEIEKSILSSIIGAYRYSDEHFELLTSIKLNENIFNGYNKAIARTINKLNEKDYPITEDEVMKFLESVGYLKSDFIVCISKQSLPYTVVIHYLKKLEDDYKIKLLEHI